MNARKTRPSSALGPVESAWEHWDHVFGILAPDAILARPIPLRLL